MISHPFLYKLSKNDHVCYILGSNHSVPFEALPASCQRLIANMDHLFVEIKNIPDNGEPLPPLEYETLKKLDMLNPDYTAEHNWFTELDRADQEFFVECWEKIKDNYPKDFNPTTLRSKEICLDLLALSHQGMDYQIEEKHAKGQHAGTTTFQLDDISLREDEELIDNVSLQLKIMKSLDNARYFDGELMHDVYSPNMILRNQHFFNTLLTKLPLLLGQSLVVVGVDHLGADHGLLNQFLKQGYDIKRMNVEGDFLPTIYSCPESLEFQFQKGREQYKEAQRKNVALSTIDSLISSLLDDEFYHESNDELISELNALSAVLQKHGRFKFKVFNSIESCVEHYSEKVKQKCTFNKKMNQFHQKINCLEDALLDPTINYTNRCDEKYFALQIFRSELEFTPIAEIERKLANHEADVKTLVKPVSKAQRLRSRYDRPSNW